MPDPHMLPAVARRFRHERRAAIYLGEMAADYARAGDCDMARSMRAHAEHKHASAVRLAEVLRPVPAIPPVPCA